MRRSRSTGITLVVAILIVGLATPAVAKKGGHPGPPSDTGLEVTVEPRGVFMWANSVGDQILFDIAVTNSSGGPLTDVKVDFSGLELITLDLAKNETWVTEYTHTITGTISTTGNTGDFAGAPISTQTEVTVGEVTATAASSDISDSAPAVTTAYPVLPCDQAEDGSFTFGPNEDYSECSFIGSGTWTLTTTLDPSRPVRGKRDNPGATVRDGIPGNWCATGDPIPNGNTVIDYQFLPPDDDVYRGTCLDGGAGGDPILVRNTDTFYLATWKGNTVVAAPSS